MAPELTTHGPTIPTAGTRRLSGRFGRRTWVLLVLIAVVAGGLSLARVLISGGAAPETAPTSSFSNQEGGYSLRFPSTWTATAIGPTTRFSSPSNDVVVGVGKLPAGALAAASQSFTDEVLRLYRGVRINGRQAQRIGGRPALLTAGDASNLTRAHIRWMTITIDYGGKNFGISVFTNEGSDPKEVLPDLQRLVASFRATP
ncbi:MAG: hypothetical protein ABR548_01350 [Actinomycetota bacterium]|nr:hypothetical protein [Actinomycetota bacterium]